MPLASARPRRVRKPWHGTSGSVAAGRIAPDHIVRRTQEVDRMPRELEADDRRRLADEDRWLTVAEVARRLRIDPETARSWLREGRLPAGAADADGDPRVRLSDLEAFLLEQR